jgi:group I intron endonuclease
VRGYIKRITGKVNSIIGRAFKKYGYSNFSFTILEYCEKSDLNAREQYYFDTLNPVYNILKKVGGLPRGVTRSEETRKLMSLSRTGQLNPLYGKFHSEETKDLMRQKALGRKYSEESKLLMASTKGFSIYVYEKSTIIGEGEGEFKLIGSFVSARRAGTFLGISHSTVRKYLDSSEILKNRYKFASSDPSKD